MGSIKHAAYQRDGDTAISESVKLRF